MDSFFKYPSPIFLQSKHEEMDEIRFKERMRRLEKSQNEFAVEMTKEESYLLMAWISKRILTCERCNVQFYSNEGFIQHRCFR